MDQRLQIVASGGRLPTCLIRPNADGGRVVLRSRRIVMFGPGGALSAALVYGNWYSLRGLPNRRPCLIRASLRLPGGDAVPLTFGGEADGVLPAGGALTSDAVDGRALGFPDALIPGGTIALVEDEVTSTSGGRIPVLTGYLPSADDGEGCAIEGGTLPGEALSPLLGIVGAPARPMPALLAIGSSFVAFPGGPEQAGYTQTAGCQAGSGGLYERASHGRAPWSLFACLGNRIAEATFSAPLALMAYFATHAVLNCASAEILHGVLPGETLASSRRMWSSLSTAGCLVHQATVPPRLLSGEAGTRDLYRTLEGQTPMPGFERGGARDELNALFRTAVDGRTLHGVIDLDAVLRDPVLTDRWRCNGEPWGYTTDGTHPVQAGFVEGAALIARSLDLYAADLPA